MLTPVIVITYLVGVVVAYKLLKRWIFRYPIQGMKDYRDWWDVFMGIILALVTSWISLLVLLILYVGEKLWQRFLKKFPKPPHWL